jgi:hypothetical protein
MVLVEHEALEGWVADICTDDTAEGGLLVGLAAARVVVLPVVVHELSGATGLLLRVVIVVIAVLMVVLLVRAVLVLPVLRFMASLYTISDKGKASLLLHLKSF